ncbi:hypothetical protein SBV1_2450013 [Verrucomicrobia bacterium]|nr:hypothetical protein SBV1_2450013 [Verrucomicrobiota bacterium]
MTIYADTSFIVASRVRHDVFHRVALTWFERHENETWLWSPWHRVEVLNTIRQLTRDRDDSKPLSVMEAKAIIRRLEADVRRDYLVHMEADWRDVLRAASEISVGNAFDRGCSATDLLHVAYALELASDLFVTFDKEQWKLAGSTGLNAESPS